MKQNPVTGDRHQPQTPPTAGVNPTTHVWVRFPVLRHLLPDLKAMAKERRVPLGDWFGQVLENEIIDYRHAQQLVAGEEGNGRDPQVRAQLRREEILPSIGFRKNVTRPALVTGDKADA